MNDFQFGDIIENGWASDDNPTKRGVFLYYRVRTGRLNPGKHAVLRSDGGSLGEFKVGKDSKLKKVGTIFDARDAEIERLKDAIVRPYVTLFLDGRNERGSFVLDAYPRSFEPDVGDLENQAEEILKAAEEAGFTVGEDHVWAEFTFVPDQVGEFGMVEFPSYWEFKGINVEMSRTINASGALKLQDEDRP